MTPAAFRAFGFGPKKETAVEAPHKDTSETATSAA